MTMTEIPHATFWRAEGNYTDILYHKSGGIAKITINRPEVRNAFRPLTVEEMRHALSDARDDHEIGVIILTGAGRDAFCSGGDQRIRGEAGYRDETGVPRLNVLDFQKRNPHVSKACRRHGRRLCDRRRACFGMRRAI